MHRTAACLTAIFLAGCSTNAAVFPKVSLKDDQPKPIATAAVAPVVVQPHTVKVTAHGGEGLTKVDLELAMAKALRAKGYKVVEESQHWSVVATVSGPTIVWAVSDRTGPKAVIRQVVQDGEIRGSDAVAAANAAVEGVVRMMPNPKGQPL